MQEEKLTLYELLTGIVICLLLFMLGNLFPINRLPYTVGVLVGGIVAMVLVCHMHSSLQNATLHNEETAVKKIKKSVLIRNFIMLGALMAAIVMPQYVSVVGMMLGIISLKFSAFLQPLTHKFFSKFINKGR